MMENEQICEKCKNIYKYIEGDTPEKYARFCSDNCIDQEKWINLRQEMDSCDECLSLKAQGSIPAVCQYHLDKQFGE